MSWNEASGIEGSRLIPGAPASAAPGLGATTSQIDAVLSRKLAAMRWFAIILVVWIHGFNSYPRYLLPDTRAEEALNASSFIQYLVSNGLARFVMPLLFAQSGFLFFFGLGAAAELKGKITKRFRSLVIPYVLWSCFGIAVVVLARNTPSLQTFMPQYLREMNWSQMGHGFLLHPVSFQLWYLRDLFVNALLSPLVYLICRHRSGAVAWLLVLLIAWSRENEPLPLLTAEGLLFFSLGAVLALHRLPLQRSPRRPVWLLLAAAWLALGALRAGLAFDPSPMAQAWVFGLYKVCNLLGLWVVWFAYDLLVGDIPQESSWWPWFGVSFYVFAAHQPLYNVLSDNILGRIGHHELLHSTNPGGAFAVYLILPVLAIVTLSLLGRAIRAGIPGLHRLLTGGR